MTQLQLITAAQVAERLGEDIRTVQRKAKAGHYPAVKLPGATGAFVFDAADIDAIAQERADASRA